MNWAEFESAYEDARRTIAKAQSIREWACSLLVDNLRGASLDRYDLAALKRELMSFDARSGEWK